LQNSKAFWSSPWGMFGGPADPSKVKNYFPHWQIPGEDHSGRRSFENENISSKNKLDLVGVSKNVCYFAVFGILHFAKFQK
jgi:hypothetical protein